MSKKKKNRQKEPDIPVLKQEISIQDDPYWKVSSLHIDMQRLGRSMIRFEHFVEEYPEWVEPLMEGIPTWYCVLGVYRGASEEEIEKAYSKKSQLSYFTRFFIEEAYDVLTDKNLQKKYDELLSLFEQYSKSMSPSEKKELIENHNENIKCEKEFIRMSEIQRRYNKFLDIQLLGAPGLYEIIGSGKDASIEDIKKKCETGSELFKKIESILCDPKKRDDYDFLMYFIGRYRSAEDHEQRNRKIKKWEQIDRKSFEQIILMSLDPDDSKRTQERIGEIMNANQDWMKYLPPNKDTFFSILGIDPGLLTGDKKEIEKILREKYRPLEKTPLVNLAYSVLKNESQRADYIWMLENGHIFTAMKFITSDEDEEKENKGVFGKLKKEKGKKKKSQKKVPPQITFDDLERMFNKIMKEMRL
jgi:curved DNA-binding protein CbpA